MLLELDDIRPFIPQIISEVKMEVRKELEEEKFLSYPNGLIKHLYGDEPGFDQKFNDPRDRSYYYRVNKIWNKRGFPKIDDDNLKGVYLSDLKSYFSK